MMQFAWLNIQRILFNVLLSDSYDMKSDDAAGWQTVKVTYLICARFLNEDVSDESLLNLFLLD